MAALSGEAEFAGVLSSTYPLFCDHPQKNPDWQQTIAGQAETGCQVILVGGCFLGKGKEIPSAEQVRISILDQCFYMIASCSLVDHYMQAGAYVLTPGWLEDRPRWMAQ
jgi:hypothetical protein